MFLRPLNGFCLFIICWSLLYIASGQNLQSGFLENWKTGRNQPRDCVDLHNRGYTTSDIYTVYYSEGNEISPVRVYCDMDTDDGGWLVFQTRRDGEVNFYRNWTDYYYPFGDLDSEFWLGLYNIYRLTSDGRQYTLRIDLEDFDNVTRFAEYNTFTVGRPRDKFPLYVDGYSGNAGDSFGHTGSYAIPFSTMDADHDEHAVNCAAYYAGAGGWWYTACHGGVLNGAYLKGTHTTYANGVNWKSWHGYYYSLKRAEMKFKPNN